MSDVYSMAVSCEKTSQNAHCNFQHLIFNYQVLYNNISNMNTVCFFFTFNYNVSLIINAMSFMQKVCWKCNLISNKSKILELTFVYPIHAS